MWFSNFLKMTFSTLSIYFHYKFFFIIIFLFVFLVQYSWYESVIHTESDSFASLNTQKWDSAVSTLYRLMQLGTFTEMFVIVSWSSISQPVSCVCMFPHERRKLLAFLSLSCTCISTWTTSGKPWGVCVCVFCVLWCVGRFNSLLHAVSSYWFDTCPLSV